MAGSEIRSLLAAGFEIGSHTVDHCYLTSVDDATAQYQIVDGKSQLEQEIGEPVPGFCYPGGKYTERHRAMVEAAGFIYARNTKNLHADILNDPYAMPVSVQLYPHSPAVFLRNFIRNGAWPQRSGLLARTLFKKDLLGCLKGALDLVCLQGGVFHLWGHSWEMDQFDGWSVLDDFLAYAAERIPVEDRLTNFEVLYRRSVLL